MNYTSTYKSTKSNSGNMSLDKGIYEEYNQRKKKAGVGVSLSSIIDSAAPAVLKTSGTNIGEASLSSKLETPETHSGAEKAHSSYIPLSTAGTNIGEASLSRAVKPQNVPFGINPVKEPSKKISYADSGKMVDYLYRDENLGNSLDFLARNDYPTPEDRELNKQFYGEAEEREHLYNRFMDKTNNALNPKLPDETDRLFLSGFLGDEEEQAEFDRKVAEAQREKDDILNQFKDTEFSYLFDDDINTYTPKNLMAIDAKMPSDPVKAGSALNVTANKSAEDKKIDHNWLWRFRDDFEKPDKWVWALTALASTYASGLHPAQIAVRNPAFHKAVWAAGAEAFLKPKGYTEAARLLKHSLQFNPQDLHEDGSSGLAQLLREDKNFNNWVKGLAKNSDGKTFKDQKRSLSRKATCIIHYTTALLQLAERKMKSKDTGQ